MHYATNKTLICFAVNFFILFIQNKKSILLSSKIVLYSFRSVLVMTPECRSFSHMLYMTRMLEFRLNPVFLLSPPGTTVMTMMAFDADDPATDNAALRYNIVRQSPGNPSSNMFYIDAERGDIVTAISPVLLDREVGPLANRECVCVRACASWPSGTKCELLTGQVLFRGVTPYVTYMSVMLPMSRVKKICVFVRSAST